MFRVYKNLGYTPVYELSTPIREPLKHFERWNDRGRCESDALIQMLNCSADDIYRRVWLLYKRNTARLFRWSVFDKCYLVNHLLLCSQGHPTTSALPMYTRFSPKWIPDVTDAVPMEVRQWSLRDDLFGGRVIGARRRNRHQRRRQRSSEDDGGYSDGMAMEKWVIVAGWGACSATLVFFYMRFMANSIFYTYISWKRPMIWFNYYQYALNAYRLV